MVRPVGKALHEHGGLEVEHGARDVEWLARLLRHRGHHGPQGREGEVDGDRLLEGGVLRRVEGRVLEREQGEERAHRVIDALPRGRVV